MKVYLRDLFAIYLRFNLSFPNRIQSQHYIQKMNEIKIPEALLDSSGIFGNINRCNMKAFEHVEYLRELITNMHQMYNQLCKRSMQLSEEYERKINGLGKNKTENEEVVLDFVKTIYFIHFSIGNQLNSNTVTLGTKTHRVARDRVDNLKDRLLACQQMNQEFVKDVKEYNKNERAFTEKCQYFSDYQKDVLKYYSLKQNVQLHEKLQIKEIKIKQALENIIQKKEDYQTNIFEVKARLKDYFELEQNIISEYSKLLFNIRKLVNGNSSQIYAQPIIEQPSAEIESTLYRGQPPLTNRSERPAQKSIEFDRQEITRDERRIVSLQTYFDQFLKQFQGQVKLAGERIDQARSSSEFDKFVKSKMIMIEIFSEDSNREIDLIVNEISVFRKIILDLGSCFGKMRVLKEITKYRVYNYDRFLQDTNTFFDLERKGAALSLYKADYNKLHDKFKARNNELLYNYRAIVNQLKENIRAHYEREEVLYSESKIKKKHRDDLFSKPYYQALMHPFFLNRLNTMNYVQNPHLKKLSMHLSANQIQNAMTLDNFYKPKKKKGNRTCCGLFEANSDDQGPLVIDQYHCAMIDGRILIQGKMKMYQNYVSFYSNFNSKTLFGRSDLRVPKWDILQVLNDKHLLSLKIVIETTHGNLEFTSFLTSPYDTLVRLYQIKKHGISNFHKNTVDGDSQVAALQQRFQSHFQAELLKVNVIVDKLSTYLSQDKEKLSISVEYHLNGSSAHSLFEIKIIQKGFAYDYIFIHDQQCKDNDNKNLLETVSKQLINRKNSEVSYKVTEMGKENKLECSIIEGNQKNQLSFHREPSFIAKKEENGQGDFNEEVKGSQISFDKLLSSKVILELSKNNELDNKFGSPHINRYPSGEQQSLNLNNILAQTGRASASASQKEQKQNQKTVVLIESSTSFRGLDVPLQQKKINNTSKRSKSNKARSSMSRSKNGAADGPNFKIAIYIIVLVLGLNLLLQLFTG